MLVMQSAAKHLTYIATQNRCNDWITVTCEMLRCALHDSSHLGTSLVSALKAADFERREALTPVPAPAHWAALKKNTNLALGMRALESTKPKPPSGPATHEARLLCQSAEALLAR